MEEIRALPWNGRRVVSLFSGCGGSCLGFRMAGYRVVWANEFVEAARDTYRANHDTPLDARDIRNVKAEEILAATGLEAGALDVLEGSPPCASFSMAGKRSRDWNKVKAYSDTAQRSDDLFFEYARILRGLMPKVFVAENVSGLVRGVAKGYFIEILGALRACGYRVKARMLDAQWLGVPQARQRIIFAGVREDLGRDPVYPEPLAYRYTVRDALPWVDRIEGGNGYDGHAYYSADNVSATIQASRPLFINTKKGARSLDRPSPTVQTHGNAKTESELTLTVETESNIAGYAIGDEWDRIGEGGQSEKYFNLLRADRDQPSPTILATAVSLAGKASVCHPTEKRKFSIAELKRICAFPDDFVLTGTYAQQWERLGRAVPPLMMRAVAAAIRDRVLA